jgi:hypothetical protein
MYDTCILHDISCQCGYRGNLRWSIGEWLIVRVTDNDGQCDNLVVYVRVTDSDGDRDSVVVYGRYGIVTDNVLTIYNSIYPTPQYLTATLSSSCPPPALGSCYLSDDRRGVPGPI